METLDHWNHANSTTPWLLVQETLRATQVAKNKLEINTNTKNRHKGRGIETDLGQLIMFFRMIKTFLENIFLGTLS